jgi:hypothetical protein
MKKIQFPVILLIAIILACIYYWGYNFIYKSASNDLMEQQLKAARYQSELVANILSDRLKKGYSKEDVINNLQQALENTPSDPIFICMFDKYGKEIIHPDREKIGITISEDDSTIKSFSNMDLEENFKTVLSRYTSYGGLHIIKDKTEVIYLSPVKHTDWIIASHSNLISLENILNNIKTKLMLFFILIWIFSIALLLFLVNILYKKYLDKISKETFQIKTQIIESQHSTNHNQSQTRDQIPRFLAEKGLKLIPIEVENIAFIYLENKITYVVDFNGLKSSLNLTLEEVYQKLPKEQFFRISRQIILSLKSIDNVEKYGLTQLRAITKPVSDIPIIISKSKISEFKSWIGKK